MKIKSIFDTITADNRRVLILLLAFLAIFLMGTMNSTKSAYAAGTGPQPQNQYPGGGGGFSPTPDTICGIITDINGVGSPTPANLEVCLAYGTSYTWTYTDSNGVF